MIRVGLSESDHITIDYQEGAKIARQIQLEGYPVWVDLDHEGRIVSVTCDSQNYDTRPQRILIAQGV